MTMNDRDLDALVLKHFGLPEEDKFRLSQSEWVREYNRIARDHDVLRAAASKISGLADNDMSAPAVLARHLFVVAERLSDHLRREVENRHKAVQDASLADKEAKNADALLLGITALEREVAKVA